MDLVRWAEIGGRALASVRSYRVHGALEIELEPIIIEWGLSIPDHPDRFELFDSLAALLRAELIDPRQLAAAVVARPLEFARLFAYAEQAGRVLTHEGVFGNFLIEGSGIDLRAAEDPVCRNGALCFQTLDVSAIDAPEPHGRLWALAVELSTFHVERALRLQFEPHRLIAARP